LFFFAVGFVAGFLAIFAMIVSLMEERLSVIG
jgi:hypothetical protein